MSEIAIAVLSVAVSLFLAGIPGQPLVGYFWTANVLADFCLIYLSSQHLLLAFSTSPGSVLNKLCSFSIFRALFGLLLAAVLCAWVAFDPACAQEIYPAVCTSWLPVFNPGSFTGACPPGMRSCGIQDYEGGKYAKCITIALLVLFVSYTLSPCFLLHIRQRFRWRLWDLPNKCEISCLRSLCRGMVLAVVLLAVLGGLCNRVRGGWRADFGFLADTVFFGAQGYLTGRACLSLGTGFLTFLLTGNTSLCLLLILTTLVAALPLGCSVLMAREIGLCLEPGMFDWVVGSLDIDWPSIPVGTCTICGGVWDSCMVFTSDCNFFPLRAWRRAWSEMWLRGLVWFLPSGLVFYKAGFGLSLLVGGAVMFPALYELGWHLPTLSVPTSSWPFGPPGYQMLGTAIDWAELLLGVYAWLMMVLSVLAAPQLQLEPESPPPVEGGDASQPFIVWAQDNEAPLIQPEDLPPPYTSPSSSFLGPRNSVSSNSSARIVVIELTPSQRALHNVREAFPLTISEGPCCARVACGLLVCFNWLHVFLTMVTLPLLGIVIVENNFV